MCQATCLGLKVVGPASMSSPVEPSPVDVLIALWLTRAPRDRATDFVILPMGSKVSGADVIVNEALVRTVTCPSSLQVLSSLASNRMYCSHWELTSCAGRV